MSLGQTYRTLTIALALCIGSGSFGQGLYSYMLDENHADLSGERLCRYQALVAEEIMEHWQNSGFDVDLIARIVEDRTEFIGNSEHLRELVQLASNMPRGETHFDRVHWIRAFGKHQLDDCERGRAISN